MASDPRGIARGLDVRVLVEVDARADRDALRQVLAAAGHAHADQRFGIGAHAAAELLADRRQRALLLQAEEQIHRAERRGGEDHAAAGEAARAPGARQAVDGTVRTS